MIKQNQMFNNLNLCADAVVTEICKTNNPFDTPVIVFANTKVEQWFKAYYLKNNSNVLMNVEFKTMASFINEIINPNGEYTVMNNTLLRDCLIKAIQDYIANNPTRDNVFNYIYSNGEFDAQHLYEFSDKLATILYNMYLDGEKITENWQKELYESAEIIGEQYNEYLPKKLAEKTFRETFRGSDKTQNKKVYVLDNSYISKLYMDILEKSGYQITIFSLEDKHNNDELYSGISTNPNQVSAPSVMRELEFLHTDICKKLIAEKNLKTNDFVVYMPDVNEYASSIRRVFEKIDTGFFELPYRIADETKEQFNMLRAMELLYEIANKQFFTRYDLLKLLKNEMFMYINDIDDEDIDAFMDAVYKTNSHRNGTEIYDWDRFKKRLLTASLVDSECVIINKTVLSGGDVLPYSDMKLDSKRINKLIDIIDCLNAWIDLFKNKNKDLSKIKFSKDDIRQVEEKLNALFSKVNADSEEKNYIYANVKNELENIILIFEEIPAITLLLMLKGASGVNGKCPADVFSGGVTFLKLTCDNIVPAKYVYVLGLSSNNYPKIEKRSEIDKSKHELSQYYDMLCINNLKQHCKDITYSYVNGNLKNGEEYFPSKVIPTNITNQKSINIDENRDYGDLFTAREIMRKKYIDRLNGISSEVESAYDDESILDENPLHKENDLDTNLNNDIVITTNAMKKFFENTIIYKYKCILNVEDDEDEKQREKYELLDLGGLQNYKVPKDIILSDVEAGISETDEKELLKMKGDLPKAGLDDLCFEGLYKDSAEPVIKIIKKGFEKIPEIEYKLPKSNVTFKINSNVYVKNEGNTLSFIEVRGADKSYGSKDKEGNITWYTEPFLTMYACALVYIAEKFNENKVHVNFYGWIKGQSEVRKVSFNRLDILNTLKRLADKMMNLDNIRYMTADIIDSGASFGDYVDLDNEISKYESPFKYFKDKNLLNPRVDFGYNNEATLATEMDAEMNDIKSLILFLQ